jgi:lipopolysaccharide export LptBFGC system permease protein LptF
MMPAECHYAWTNLRECLHVVTGCFSGQTESNLQIGEFHGIITLDSGETRRAIIPECIQISPGMSNTYLLADTAFLMAGHKYMNHLSENNQTVQRYEIEFWRKVFYPLSCWVMLTLALPFAYLHFRSGNIAGYVFGGVMAGISFYLLNNVFGFMGNLLIWQPWLTAAAPAIIYSIVSLATFGWLVIRQ